MDEISTALRKSYIDEFDWIRTRIQLALNSPAVYLERERASDPRSGRDLRDVYVDRIGRLRRDEHLRVDESCLPPDRHWDTQSASLDRQELQTLCDDIGLVLNALSC